MHYNPINETQPESNRYEKALAESVNQYVDELMQDDDSNHVNLIPRDVRHKKLEFEVLETLGLKQLDAHIANAIRILKDESKQYLSDDEYQALIECIDSIRTQFDTLDVSRLMDESLKQVFGFSNQNMMAIKKVAIAKYNEKQLPDCLSIYTFLTSLDSEDPDYWYRLAMTAQDLELFDQALQAYAKVLELAPEFIGARLFKAQCCLTTNRRADAVAEITEIKEIIKTSETDPQWIESVADLESLVAEAK